MNDENLKLEVLNEDEFAQMSHEEEDDVIQMLINIGKDIHACNIKNGEFLVVKNNTIKDICNYEDFNNRYILKNGAKILDREKFLDIYSNIGQLVEKRLIKHGKGGLSSTHEIYGILCEEMKELMETLHKNDLIKFEEELYDVLLCCFFGLASIYSKTIKW